MRPGVVVLGVGIPLVALGLVVTVALWPGDDGAGGGASTTTAPPATPEPRIDAAWNGDVAAAFQPLEDVLVELASSVDRRATGAASDAELAASLDRIRPHVVAVRDAVAELEPHPGDALAQPLVATSAELYVHAVDAHTASLEAGTPDLSRELDKLGRRLRILADRIFDRARERTSAPVDLGDDVRVVRPAEVPDWERLELAAGPPLERVDPNRPDELPLERRTDRLSQPEQDWLAVVRDLDAPTAADVRSAGGDDLAPLARRLVAAAEALRDVPVPGGDRGRADRLALGWLLRADAARAAQVADIEPAVPGLEQLAASVLALSATHALSAVPQAGGG